MAVKRWRQGIPVARTVPYIPANEKIAKKKKKQDEIEKLIRERLEKNVGQERSID